MPCGQSRQPARVVCVAAVGSPRQLYFSAENQLVVCTIDAQIGTLALMPFDSSISVRLKDKADCFQKWNLPTLKHDCKSDFVSSNIPLGHVQKLKD